jgi:hypothetical protein
MWARIEKAAKKDPKVAEGRERILDHAAEDPEPEYTAMHLGAAALLAAEETGSRLSSTLAQLCDELDARQAVGAAETAQEGQSPTPA